MYEFASFFVTETVVRFFYSEEVGITGPSGSQPHNGDPWATIDEILTAFPAEDIETDFSEA